MSTIYKQFFNWKMWRTHFSSIEKVFICYFMSLCTRFFRKHEHYIYCVDKKVHRIEKTPKRINKCRSMVTQGKFELFDGKESSNKKKSNYSLVTYH